MKHIILNPYKNDAINIKLAEVCQMLDGMCIDYQVHKTTQPKEAIEITRDLTENGHKEIIALGGDGTLNEVLNGFTNFESCRLGLIPCGTGNDFASCVQIPHDTKKSLDIILGCTPKYTDFMQMPTVRGINLIGAGIDVDVLRKYESKKKPTRFSYMTSFIYSLFHFKKYNFSYECNGKKGKNDCFIACVANGKTIGGGIKMCPEGVVDDGLLDFVVCKYRKKILLPIDFISVMRGKILETSFTEHQRCQKVKIESDALFSVQVDGEIYDNIPFEVEIVKNKLLMYRP